jgi:hypothetical protein
MPALKIRREVLKMIARAVQGDDPVGTLNKTSLTFAMMEFLVDADSNQMKSHWRKLGFTDISPKWGNRDLVPTFKQDPAIIKQWTDFQSQMAGVEADWYYLSGHHGRRFKSDLSLYPDWVDHINDTNQVGIFNEVYHHGPWEHDSQSSPDAHRSALDVYMQTGSDWVYDMGPTDNPLYGNVHSSCRGFIFVGCNYLMYRSVRQMMAQYFPNALIISTMGKESNAISKIIRVANQYGRELFMNPAGLDHDQLCRDLSKGPGRDHMGLMYKGVLHYHGDSGVVHHIGPDEPLTSQNTA